MDTNQSELVVEVAAAEEVRSKVFRFGEIKRGDCTIRAGAELTLRSDGSIQWKCDVQSSDSGDKWEGGFRFLSNADGELFVSDKWWYYIREENTWYRWEETARPNADYANRFDDVAKVSFRCSC